MKYTFPFLYTFTSNHFDSALTTDAPTPWSPPDTLYPPPPNFPPAWSTVYTVSTVDFLVFGCISTGIPLPLSFTVIELSLLITTSICVQNPLKLHLLSYQQFPILDDVIL